MSVSDFLLVTYTIGVTFGSGFWAGRLRTPQQRGDAEFGERVRQGLIDEQRTRLFTGNERLIGITIVRHVEFRGVRYRVTAERAHDGARAA